MTTKTQLGTIAAAAHALEIDLDAFEAAAATATRLPLTSQRNLDKAARAVNEAAESQRRTGEHLAELMAALNEARDRNQVTAAALQVRGAEIQARADEHARHLAAFQALGKVAKAISEAVRVVGTAKSAAPRETATVLGEIEHRMTEVVDQAGALLAAAQDAGLPELARDIEGLHKQVQSARNKLALVRAKIAQ